MKSEIHIGEDAPRRKWPLYVALAVMLALGAGIGVWHVAFHGRGAHEGAHRQMYTCPMHPQYTADRPGECPICGMDLVPMKKEATDAPMPVPESKPAVEAPEGETRAAVTIDATQQQRIGVKTATVARGSAATTLRAAGQVAFDPDLVVAQREFLDARRLGDASLARAARQRLMLMGLSEEQIGELVRKGTPDENLIQAAKKAWIYATVYEREIPFVRVGQQATIELPDGGTVGTGVIRGIDPVLDPKTRAVRARIEVANDQGTLKPNMFVTAILKNDLGEKLLVPKSAVIDTGKRKVVFMVHEGSHFMPHDVVLGPELDENYVVESGLAAGDIVAVGALFLIDSESKLKAGAGAEHKH